MTLRVAAILCTLSLNGFQPMHAVDHFNMAERTYGDEGDAWAYFLPSNDVPASPGYPLWQTCPPS